MGGSSSSRLRVRSVLIEGKVGPVRRRLAKLASRLAGRGRLKVALRRLERRRGAQPLDTERLSSTEAAERAEGVLKAVAAKNG